MADPSRFPVVIQLGIHSVIPRECTKERPGLGLGVFPQACALGLSGWPLCGRMAGESPHRTIHTLAFSKTGLLCFCFSANIECALKWSPDFRVV